FNGERWASHWQQNYDATVLTVPPDNVPHPWSAQAKVWLASHRQIIETVFARLDQVFHIKHPNAHSRWGLYTRVAATIAAYNIGLFINRLLNRPLGALATLIC
ncbi:MAG: transposase, partial [Anaerolineae bacterium]|nr:transposase [Anaerolineae bacterium]